MATYTGGEGLKSMRCRAMAAKRGRIFLIHTKGAQGLAVSLPDCLMLPAAQSQWSSPSQQWSLLVPQAKTRGTQHGWGMPVSLLWTWESAGGGMMPPSHVLVLWVLGDLRSLHPAPAIHMQKQLSPGLSPLCTSPFGPTSQGQPQLPHLSGQGWHGGLNAGATLI